MNSANASLPLADRNALITGADRGIGRAIALGYARAGANIVVNYLSEEGAARRVVEEAQVFGVKAIALQSDIACIERHAALFQEATRRLGPIHILVNNAATEPRGPILEASEAVWDHTLAVNLKGAFFLTQRAARLMIAADIPGRIINISSTHEHRPLSQAAIYSISKSGLAMLTKSFAQELAPKGIAVNALIPGAIRTELNRAVLADPVYEAKVTGRIPVGRLGWPDDLVAAAVFLAGQGAAYMTGASLTIDGGLSL